MKLFTFTIALLLISVASFAQSAVCPNYFRRNNGNGACPDGELKLFYNTCPAYAPIIDSVYINDVKANVSFGLPDLSKCNSQDYISYCIIGTNTAPAAAWKIFFHNNVFTDPYGCLIPEGGPLPITLTTFSAKRDGGSVDITWETSYELNGQAFEIQLKSGSGFITVGSVLATNNISGHAYSFTDKNNRKESMEYRLKLLSKDAVATYSEIRSVKGLSAAIDFTVFPNPAAKNSHVSVTNINELSEIQVIDNTGRLVRSIPIKAGNSIQLNGLPAGLFRIRLINKNSGEATTKTLTILQ